MLKVHQINLSDPSFRDRDFATTVITRLAQHGAVLFDGGGLDARGFSSLTKQFSSRFTVDPGKVSNTSWRARRGATGKAVRLANRVLRKTPIAPRSTRPNSGTRTAPFDGNGINAHSENTFIPRACPDLVWFYCDSAAEQGGTSILCDGIDTLASLADQAVDYAENSILRYELSLSAGEWSDVYEIHNPDDLGSVLDGCEGLRYNIGSDSQLDYVFDTRQTKPTLFDMGDSLSTNVLSRHPFGQVSADIVDVTSNGDPVPAWFVEELLRATSANSIELDLKPGQILMIDNSRVLHGRTPFTDSSRRVHTRCSWLDTSMLQSTASDQP